MATRSIPTPAVERSTQLRYAYFNAWFDLAQINLRPGNSSERALWQKNQNLVSLKEDFHAYIAKPPRLTP
jgi:hypothetical protein